MLGALREQMFGRTAAPRIDRFELRDMLGRGGFGCVYEAEDAELGRRVAIKLLHRSADRDNERATRRFIREAQALAQLSHPNVVQIYASGIHRGRVWLAMELVRGQTLRQWLTAHPPGSDAHTNRALPMLIDAGRGLEAGHARGIVHRDFKPDNVLVGDDGRVRVVDFGLARWTDEAELPSSLSDSESASADGDASEPLTRPNAVLGTPRYMSPEQFSGRPVDERSDQFNFAVTAWEVLGGMAPFRGRSVAEQYDAVVRQVFTPHPNPMPSRRVESALRRALSVDPKRRFDSMQELLVAMGEPASNRWALGAIAGGLVGVVGWGVTSTRARPEEPPCDARVAEQQLAEVWNGRRRAAVVDALQGKARAGTRADAVVEALDDHGRKWTEAQVQACRAAWNRSDTPDPDAPDPDATLSCLRDGLAVAEGLVARLESPTDALAQGALQAVESLPKPQRCRESATEASPDDALSREAAELHAATIAYDYAGAEARAERLAALARAEGRRDVLAVALQGLGNTRAIRLERRAVEPLTEAYTLSIELGDYRRASGAAARLARLHATLTAFEDAEKWIRHAETALERAENADAKDRAVVAKARCWVEHEANMPSQIEACESALETGRIAGGQAEIDALRLMAQLYTTVGQGAMADVLLDDLYRQVVARYGRVHPETVLVLDVRSRTAGMLNRPEDALALIDETIDIETRLLGPDHPNLVHPFYRRGYYLGVLQRFDEAEAAFEQALRVLDEATGLDETKAEIDRCQTLDAYANMLADRGELDRGIEMLRDVAFRQRTILPADHPQVMTTHLSLGTRLFDAAQLEGADEELAPVHGFLARYGHPRLSEVAYMHGVVLSELGRYDDARESLEQSITASGAVADTSALGSMAMLAEIAAEQGEVERARGWIEHAERLVPTDDASGAASKIARARARLAIASGNADLARAHLQAARQTLPELRNVHLRAHARDLDGLEKNLQRP